MAEERPLRVSEALEATNGVLKRLGTLKVLGEVTGFRGPNSRSGHCYFQLKDDSATMDAILWARDYQRLDFELRDGLEVELTGSFDVYAPSGRLSFKARTMTLAGEGLLRQQVAALARRLRDEGLMEQGRKRDIPAFCERVGVVTSLSGSVVDDVRRTLARRNPLVALELSGCTVQGDGAVPSIIRALRCASATSPDCILLVRGGGSYEDLMTFNDEGLARAVAACPVPVITGIGHEPDTTICDMVSDRRASTPTAAAESVAPSLSELVEVVNNRMHRLAQNTEAVVSREAQTLTHLGQRQDRAMESLVGRQALALGALRDRLGANDPRRVLRERAEALALTSDRLHGALPRILVRRREATQDLARRLRREGAAIPDAFRTGTERIAADLGRVGATLLEPFASELSSRAAALEALSPLKVLSRGYAIVETAGAVVRSASQVKVGQTIDIRLEEGRLEAQVSATDLERDQ